MIVSELHKHVNRCKTLVSQLFNIKVTQYFYSSVLAPSFWTVLAERRAFVTKGCTTMSACQMTSNVIAERCSRLKTRDWICSYCCNADRCNYYVPGGATRTSTFPLHVTIFFICLWNIVWKIA
ncbi:high affinity cationic amino acid transporter 1 [Schistosoma japonicum]|nr:high affinity cationic amino acid transporter 1 [Schistosoma japonicum]